MLQSAAPSIPKPNSTNFKQFSLAKFQIKGELIRVSSATGTTTPRGITTEEKSVTGQEKQVGKIGNSLTMDLNGLVAAKMQR